MGHLLLIYILREIWWNLLMGCSEWHQVFNTIVWASSCRIQVYLAIDMKSYYTRVLWLVDSHTGPKMNFLLIVYKFSYWLKFYFTLLVTNTEVLGLILVIRFWGWVKLTVIQGEHLNFFWILMWTEILCAWEISESHYGHYNHSIYCWLHCYCPHVTSILVKGPRSKTLKETW